MRCATSLAAPSNPRHDCGSRAPGRLITACKEEWPEATLPSDYFEPFQSQVPTVIISGKYDAATPPRFGDEAKPFLPNSVHLVTPESHGYPKDDSCFASVGAQLFRNGTLQGLDTRCVQAQRPLPVVMPTTSAK
jgi:hypothetical protein